MRKGHTINLESLSLTADTPAHLQRLSCLALALLTAFFLLFIVPPRAKAQAVEAALEPALMSEEEAVQLGEKFGLVVGEVDEELRKYLGLQRAEGVVVFEVIGGKPADLAGVKARSIIKEIDSKEIKTLKDFGKALKTALQTENFSLATYEPADPTNQGLTGGVQFHFVRVQKT